MRLLLMRYYILCKILMTLIINYLFVISIIVKSTSHEFMDYMKQFGIYHIRTYHTVQPLMVSQNVQFRNLSHLKKLEGNVKTRLFTFLARYRVTPHSAAELSPEELLMGRKL